MVRGWTDQSGSENVALVGVGHGESIMCHYAHLAAHLEPAVPLPPFIVVVVVVVVYRECNRYKESGKGKTCVSPMRYSLNV